MKKFQFCFLLLAVTASAVFSQTWSRSEDRDNWGDLQGTIIFQHTTCTGNGSSGEETWRFVIFYRTTKPEVITIGIVPMHQLQTAPIFVIINEDVTISVREDNNTQVFRGIVSASESGITSGTIIGCLDQRLKEALQRDANYRILIEGRKKSWYVRANIRGNMPIR
jgi:hypothetical protein